MASKENLCLDNFDVIVYLVYIKLHPFIYFVTDARQIILQTMKILAEQDNPAHGLLASALKVLNKAQHTINEEVKK